MRADTDHVQLPGGRRLDVRVSGPDDGLLLVFHHGTPGARTPIRVLERAAHARGLRLVSTSRPGYGDSTREEGRHVVDVVADTEAVLAAFGADRCVVAGWSGGGPHALACAARLPGVAAALVIAGVAPSDGVGLEWFAGIGEGNVEELGAAFRGAVRLRAFLEEEWKHLHDGSVENVVAAMSRLLPDVDRAVLTEELGADLTARFHEGLRNGVDGWLDDELVRMAGA